MVLHLIVEQSSTWQWSYNLLLDSLLSKCRCPHVPTWKFPFFIHRCFREVCVWESTDLEAVISQPQYYCSRHFGSVTFSLLIMQIDRMWSVRRTWCPWVVQCTVSAETVSRQLSAEFIFSATCGGALKWLLELLSCLGSQQAVVTEVTKCVSCLWCSDFLMGLVLSCDRGFQLFYSCLENCFSSQ